MRMSALITVWMFTLTLANNNMEAANPTTPKDYYFLNKEDCDKGKDAMSAIETEVTRPPGDTTADSDQSADKTDGKKDVDSTPVVWAITSDCFEAVIVEKDDQK